MKKSFVVFGLGRFGTAVATDLYNSGFDVMVIDNSESKVNAISSQVTVAIQANISDRAALSGIGLENFDGAIISLSNNLEPSIMAIIACKNAKIPKIWVKTRDDSQGEIFEALGATRVFIPEREHAASIARSIASSSSLDFIELSDKIDMVKIPLRTEWIGKSLIELSLRKNYGINVIAIEKGGKVTTDIIPSDPLAEGMSLFIIGHRKNTEKILK